MESSVQCVRLYSEHHVQIFSLKCERQPLVFVSPSSISMMFRIVCGAVLALETHGLVGKEVAEARVAGSAESEDHDDA